jgi:hypothetical protein
MIQSRPPSRPHRLAAQDVALSRPKPGFESPWGHRNNRFVRGGFCLAFSYHRGTRDQTAVRVCLGHKETTSDGDFFQLSVRLLCLYYEFSPAPLPGKHREDQGDQQRRALEHGSQQEAHCHIGR